MYKFEVEQKFDQESGRVKSHIKIVQRDTGLPFNIIDVGDNRSNEITLWADTWDELETIEANTIVEIKKTIDKIRENSKQKLIGRKTFEY